MGDTDGQAAIAIEGAVAERLFALERADVARRVDSVAEPLRRTARLWSDRLSNRLVKTMLHHQVRRAVAHADDPVAVADALARYRRLAAGGDFNQFDVTPGSALAATRADFAASEAEPLPGSDIGDIDLPEPGTAILIYTPGCGFILPPSPRQVGLAYRIAERCGCEAVIGRHRLAPEHAFPAPHRDLVALYAALLERGHAPEDIAVAGDSAGATLLLSMLLELRARKMPMPAAALLFSPWADLAMRGWSYVSRSLSSDSPFSMMTAQFSANLYLGPALPTDPRASPAYADLAEFPPLAIHCSRHDMHFDDAVTLSEKAHAAGVPVTMHYWDSPRHHLERFRSADADASFQLSADFIGSHVRAARRPLQ